MIEIRDLAKVYDDFAALKGISFDVGAGDLFGFIGPNGAGKTTTIRILATMLDPSGGSVRIDGHDILEAPDRVRRAVGYMPDLFGVYDRITVEEYLDFFGASYGIPRRERARRIEAVMALTDLAGLRDRMAGELSKGMKQRLCLAKTLVHDPKVLILDEPASGLDPHARIEFRALLKELRAMGKTIFLSSHILTEMEEICNAVAILERGRIVASGRVEDIRRRLRPGRVVEIEVLDGAPAAEEALRGLPSVKEIESRDHTLSVRLEGERAEIPGLVRAVVGAGAPIVRVTEVRETLEDLFMQLTKGDVA